MYKIGIDMTTISRIEKSLQNPNFRTYVFSEKELQRFYYMEKTKFASLAANFAAKEAFSKALGTGVRGFGLNEVEILRDELGAPYFNFYGRAAQIMAQHGYSAQVSLSHEGDTAIAMVLLEKPDFW